MLLCRICATERTIDGMNDLLTTIHNGLAFVDMLAECLQRSISLDDGFPLHICFDCSTKLVVVHSFHAMYNNSEKKLREVLGNRLKSDESTEPTAVVDVGDELDSDLKPSCFIDCADNDEPGTNCCDDEMSDERNSNEGDLIEPTKPLKVTRYECYMCKETYSQRRQLRKHFNNDHQMTDRVWSCSDCQKRFTHRKHLVKHLYKHVTPTCDYCRETFATLRLLHQHCQQAHKDVLVLHRCDQCPKKFVLNTQLQVHKQTHRITAHNCSVCDKSFTTELQLKGHKTAVHTTYLCSECGKTFKNNALLASHQKVHNADKPFACLKCPSRFKWRVALTYHMTIHDEEKKHVCDECGKSFSTRSSMKSHMSESVKLCIEEKA